MKANEIRKRFLNYFEDHNHEIVKSSSLIPANDETLLFTNAGMVQFKDIFLGQEQSKFARATSSQCCIRAGGKHNDLENVGYTERHHTFFEMLGNFSFGDYFKEDAILFAWQFLIEELKIPKDKLWVTVFKDDDEAEDIWIKKIGVDPKRVARLGEKDNFWAMGDTGPCGPCSEIFFDHGSDYQGTPPGEDGDEGDRYIEIWNLVFMQFNRDSDGKLNPLPKPSVDTGMGLERIAAVMQGVNSNYDTDLLSNLVKSSNNLLKVNDAISHKVIADHIRSVVFLLLEGILPSNEGRGYVLRRILRRAVRHGYKLGARSPFMSKLVDCLVKEMGEAYPQLAKSKKLIEDAIHQEEKKFFSTLETGISILNKEILELNNKLIPGDLAFKLHDTYGFPIDLTADIAREEGFQVDEVGFERCMKQQIEISKQGEKFQTADLNLEGLPETNFIGYEKNNLNKESIISLWNNNQPTSMLKEGESGVVIFKNTPFYAESGGQVGDNGRFKRDDNIAEVTDCKKQGKIYLHHVKVISGSIEINEEYDLTINQALRKETMSHHSATHLLHAALKQVLGEHVSQKGSLNDANRLRFDFSHPKALTQQEIDEVQNIVNNVILQDTEAITTIMKLEDAIESGAEAMFGEKYDDEVRVVDLGDKFSIELCGGTHVKRTGDIGTFFITNESSVASGVRRIEAVVGKEALNLINNSMESLREIQKLLKVPASEISSKLTKIIDENKQLRKNQSAKVSKPKVIKKSIIKSANASFEIMQIDEDEINILRAHSDILKQENNSNSHIIFGIGKEKSSIVISVVDAKVGTFSAKELLSQIIASLGGKGGGKDIFAQGVIESTDPKSIVNSIDDVINSSL